MENQRLEDNYVDRDGKTSLHKHTRVTGTISGPGDLFLDGALKGDVAVEGLLFIGENGSVEGKVRAGNLLLAGQVHGSVTVTGKVEIRSRGRAQGNIVCQKIAIAEGAYLDGEVHTHKGLPLALDVFSEKRRELQQPATAFTFPGAPERNRSGAEGERAPAPGSSGRKRDR
ncbi:MAG: polymer-forming cytoskeletal protein [Candidatus Aminicenantes bacterium]|nr:polymer-forming cytoskeletal protein [Candidatus Aminicenantes bacterium]